MTLGKATSTSPVQLVRNALQKSANSTIPILCIGDSVTEGGIVVSFVDDRWTTKLQRAFQSRYNNGIGGVGWLNTVSSFGYGTSTCQWSGTGSLGGNTNNFGNRTMSWGTNAAVTLTYVGTSFKLQYALGGSNFTSNVDSSGAVTVTVGAGSTNQGVYSSPILASGSHTAVFTPTAGQAIQVTGAIIYNGDEATGVSIFEDALYGQTTTSALAGWASSTGLVDPLSPNICPNPVLVTLMFGLNDNHNGISTATYKTNLQSIIANVKALCTNQPIFLLCGQWLAGAYAPDGVNFGIAASQVAAADPLNCIYSSFLSTITGTNLGGDGIHPNEAGMLAIANQIAAIFTSTASPMGGSTRPYPFQGGIAR